MKINSEIFKLINKYTFLFCNNLTDLISPSISVFKKFSDDHDRSICFNLHFNKFNSFDSKNVFNFVPIHSCYIH